MWCQHHVPLHISRKQVVDTNSIVVRRDCFCLFFFFLFDMWMTDVKETVGVSFKDYDSLFSLTTSEGLKK
jgi:hypothetical protein